MLDMISGEEMMEDDIGNATVFSIERPNFLNQDSSAYLAKMGTMR